MLSDLELNELEEILLVFEIFTACMGNLLSLGAKMCIWNLIEGPSRNCDFNCKLGTYFCFVGLDCIHVMLFYMQCVFNFVCTGISIKKVYLY